MQKWNYKLKIGLGKNYLDFLNHVYFGFTTLSRYNNTH